MKRHRWTGWPGAICLDCGSEDPIENSLSEPGFDIETCKYSDPVKQAELEEALICRSKEGKE